MISTTRSTIYPKDCTFAHSDWDVLASFWYPITFSREVKDRPIAIKLLDRRLVVYREQELTKSASTTTTNTENQGAGLVRKICFEAGGHRATFATPYEQGAIGTVSLIPQVVDAVSVPVVAAGGIMDARGIVAALALGASGVQMGTAFLACPENNIPEVYRQAVLNRQDEDTVITEVFSGRPARAIRNRFIREMEHYRDEVLPFRAQMSIGRILRQASTEQSNPDFISMWACPKLPSPRCDNRVAGRSST